ncbi:R3H domain-containing protein 2 [Ameca splendens]|uniref:R3H domain-containing protein 2 n=1 Tax=Ameca splendens TaxID=208324 RepID=A0ABV0Y7I7_9TELE
MKLVRSLAVCEESSGPFPNDGPPESEIIQLHISCPSDKEEEKSSKDEYENEEKEKKDKTPRKMLSRVQGVPRRLLEIGTSFPATHYGISVRK